ncbi:MAG TPA: hypothetical protein DCG85_07215 [Lachnospiraceae bacterium]|jgi:hypothetical protein|nr:hypothetical protein [Lachnospiraceae bacterium]
MLSVESLRKFGADTGTGLSRCYDDEEFYLGLVKNVPGEQGFDLLLSALSEGEKKTAFEYAHALKGVLENLSLTPLCVPLSKLTEHLRAEDNMDYSPLISEIIKQRDALADICRE